MKELQRQASPSIVIALAGNKADLASKRMVEYEVSVSPSAHPTASPWLLDPHLGALFQEAQAYADDNSLLFMETSAKTAMNVNDLFLAIGEIGRAHV